MNDGARAALVARLHALPNSGVLAVTGGGVLLLADLLTVPGASATVLEARIPYAAGALAEFIGSAPEQSCSANTACDIAMASWQRALTLAAGDPQYRFGLGCTASLATAAAKRGEHRAHIALQTSTQTHTWSIEFMKGARNRADEERLLADLALGALADTVGLDAHLDIALMDGEAVSVDRAVAQTGWDDLLLGRCHRVSVHDAAPPRALFPGAFNPLHAGHLAMARHAERVTGNRVGFEICANNVDKPRLNFLALQHRISQFDQATPVWLTDAATFIEKARIFPGVLFIVGIDTLVRIGDPKYYGDNTLRLNAAIDEIGALGCRFLVFGRRLENVFRTLADVAIPDTLRSLCTAVPEAQFREDVSSTLLRSQGHSLTSR